MAHVPNPDNKPFVNHLNEDQADCRAVNLEWVYPRENVSYSSKQTASKFAGVTRVSNNKKAWQARVIINGKRIWLGYFKNEEAAHKAYINALRKNKLENKYSISSNA